MNEWVQGYAEGYYGRLLTWAERRQILDTLQRNGQNTYYYAPKEDALHRWQWRVPYSAEWRDAFGQFCKQANLRGIRVVAGVAPGLDFDFNHLNGGSDLESLLEKCRQLTHDGAHQISLLMDDIDADFAQRSGGLASEGLAHARLANILGDALGCEVWVTPRIYANELVIEEPNYLPDFFSELCAQHTVLYCGSDIVAHQADPHQIHEVVETGGQRLVLWDNLYANDYCPRRLYVGPWQGRSRASDVLLNPTGRVHTDCLLLDIMAVCQTAQHRNEDIMQGWVSVLQQHGVPDPFLELALFFFHPVFNEQPYPAIPSATAATFEAIEECLWRWKTPLSREWYEYLFGLKHDLLADKGELPILRIQKTQNPPLVSTLLRYR